LSLACGSSSGNRLKQMKKTPVNRNAENFNQSFRRCHQKIFLWFFNLLTTQRPRQRNRDKFSLAIRVRKE
jgi:hypothetical protein